MASSRTSLNRLKVKDEKFNTPGVHADGGGLNLRVDKLADDSFRRVWLFRYSSPIHRVLNPDGSITAVGKRREAGLGNADGVSLATARKTANDYRNLIAQNIDPIDQNDAEAAAAAAKKLAEISVKQAEKTRERTTLLRIVRAYHERVIEPDRTEKHGKQWINSIEQHVPKAILEKPVELIEPTELLDMLLELRREVPETARRIAQRLHIALADAKLRKIVPNNPMADIAHALRQSKRDREKVKTNFASLPYAEVPGFFEDLTAANGIAPLALAFTVRTCARTEETLGATWSEFDLEKGIWKVPAARMKGRQVHTVHLTQQALAILKELKKLKTKYVFASPMDSKQPLSNMAMLNVLRRFEIQDRTTVHGFRASFSSWAYEVCQRSRPDLARQDVIEACLAHRELDRIKAAYNRAEFEDDRKELLRLWSDFVDSKPAPVMEINPRARAVG